MPKNYTKPQLEWALSQTKSLHGAAKFLRCSYPTLIKYLDLYRIDKEKYKNIPGKGINKTHLSGDKKGIKVQDIVNGDYNGRHFNRTNLKYKIIREMLLPEKCDECGFSERRVVDEKVPLLLIFKDNDKTNYKLENLKLICYNCAFLYYSQSVFGTGKKEDEYFYDPDTGDIIEIVD